MRKKNYAIFCIVIDIKVKTYKTVPSVSGLTAAGVNDLLPPRREPTVHSCALPT